MRFLRLVSIALLVLVACDSIPGPDGPVAVLVPDVVGLARTSALQSLRGEGLVPTVKRKWTSGAGQGEVIRQRPGSGTSLEPGSRVVIVVARALRVVPDVDRFRVDRARRVLRRAGFRIRIVRRPGGFLGSLYPPGTAMETRPGSYAKRRPGTVVTVVVKAAPPPVEDPAPAGCHPSYSGCVPIASDVDCAGGEGNGPVYVNGPVYILGSDPYGLDSGGEPGVGCE